MLRVDREGYQEYLKSDHWRAVRQAALLAADGRCQLCYSPDRLEVHHRTYGRLGAEHPMDVTVLCGICHAAFHDLLERRKRLEFGEEAAVALTPKRWEVAYNYMAMQPTSAPAAPVREQGWLLRLARGDDPQAE